MKLSRKISLFIILLLIFTVIVTSFFFVTQWLDSLRFQMRNQAMDLAETLSRAAQIRDNIASPNGDIIIQREMERIRLHTRIQSIQIVNINGLIYAHSLESEIRKKTDNPLLNEVLVSGQPAQREGQPLTAPSFQAAAPVYHRGIFSGAVLVELFYGRIYQESRRNIVIIVTVALMTLGCGIILARFLSQNIKMSIFGLEPVEIARLLTQQHLILSGFDLGVVFSDRDGSTSMINPAARKLLGLSPAEKDVDIASFDEGPQEHLSRNGKTLLCRSYPVIDHHKEKAGKITVFEDLTEARRRAEELTGMRQLTSALRAQNHEFLNKLHSISGLIQLKDYDEALRFISDAAGHRGEITAVLTDRIREPAVAGLLLSKYNRATEARISVTIDEESYLSSSSPFVSPEDFSSILGNLIENAYEELKGRNDGEIFIGIYEGSRSLQCCIEDNGRGIPPHIRSSLFKRGVSAKGKSRGIGLSLVKEIIDRLGGTICVEGVQGTSVDIEIPGPEKTAKEESRQ
ncbi:ATP-binding protein [Marispirochaeta sp.]|uniref:ATP-binding protein n=1 Tax=Marispirochaeta sp. TaxID=2038653 RepID=UPI0029C664AE|nr:ATP-binding protein [Marispirochaeta sp.]